MLRGRAESLVWETSRPTPRHDHPVDWSPDSLVDYADVIAGFSTLAAFGAAGVAGVYAAKAAKSSSELLTVERERDEAQEKRDQDADMRIRRQQADLVTAWIEDKPQAFALACVRNESTQAIYDLRIFIYYVRDGYESLSGLLGDPTPMLRAHAQHNEQITGGHFQALRDGLKDDPPTVAWAVIIFRDSAGNYWRRRPDRDLEYFEQRP